MDLQDLQSKAGAAEALLKAVANQNRLIILCELLKGERSVTALQGAIGLSQSALSQHLARLRDDDLVATRRVSQTIYLFARERSRQEADRTSLRALLCARFRLTPRR